MTVIEVWRSEDYVWSSRVIVHGVLAWTSPYTYKWPLDAHIVASEWIDANVTIDGVARPPPPLRLIK